MRGTITAIARKVLASFALHEASRSSFSRIDALDRQIVALLQSEGRISLTELAERVRLSVSRCQRRVRALEDSGVLRGYRAVVDPAALGLGFEVLVFATLSPPDAVEEFDAALAAVPQVIEAQRLFGRPDYLIRVVSADLAAYQELYESVLVRLPGVEGLTSTIVMKQAVPLRAFPMP
jgi:DNA-binding Lrp family transcriptional regulator